MTKLLQEAFRRVSELPESEQDALAKWLLKHNNGILIIGAPMFARAKETPVGRIVAQMRLTSFRDPSKALAVSAMVDTGSAYIALPNAWRESLGEVEEPGEVELELTDQSVKKGIICGPVRVWIGEFRPIVADNRSHDYQWRVCDRVFEINLLDRRRDDDPFQAP